MESQFQILWSAIAVVLVLIVVKLGQRSKAKPNLPPGPPTLPIIGNIHQLAKSPSPHPFFRDLAMKYGGIMRIQVGEITTIVVTCPKITKQIFTTHDTKFSQRPSSATVKILTYDSSSTAFAPYSEYWRQVRKVCILELLSAKRVQSFRCIREEEGLKLMSTVASYSGEPLNFSSMIYDFTCDVVARAVFGAKCRAREEFRPLFEEMTRAYARFSIVDMFPSIGFLHLNFSSTRSARKLHKTLDVFLENVISDRKAKARDMDGDEDNILDVLLRVQADGDDGFRLTDDNIKAVVLEVFNAGCESSSTKAEWAMAELVKNPRVMRKAQEEVRSVCGDKGKVNESEIHRLHYLKLVIKESLRLHPPSPLLLPRECRESCEIGGFHIPAKSIVMVNQWAMGRDPSLWDQPLEFYPERFIDSTIDFKGNDFHFIPFGAGRRICPGITFSSAHVELLLAQFLFHFDWKLPDGLESENLNMDEVPGFAMKRKNDLRLIAIPYHTL